ncbi:MAG TPA: SPOR domain-containing protein [Bacteroidales bacterium]|nr:SPOR domain-containing protein [Bacteroidales bacterium]
MKLSFMVKKFFFRVINMKARLTFMALVLTFHLPALTVSGQDTSKTEARKEFDMKFAEAVKLQYNADSLTRLAQGVRREMETAAPEKQEVLQSIAEEIERKATAIQANADKAFMVAEQDGKPVPEVSSGAPQQEQGQAYSQFVVLSKPAYSDANPVPFDFRLPPGLIYTIQLAAFKNLVQPSLFKGLFPLYGKKKPDNGVNYYYTGLFRIYEDARQALSKVRAEGFSDAFVIAMMNDAQVSMERAAMLEKEWAGKPLPVPEAQVMEKKNITATDTLPVGTLTFRAEAMRSKKPVKPEAIEKIELLADTRGLDMIKNNQDETVFLIGNFITFESADEYVSLLIRNGYSTARVTAYVGMQEIPVEAAKELLNRIE